VSYSSAGQSEASFSRKAGNGSISELKELLCTQYTLTALECIIKERFNSLGLVPKFLQSNHYAYRHNLLSSNLPACAPADKRSLPRSLYANIVKISRRTYMDSRELLRCKYLVHRAACVKFHGRHERV
jgi:hypothetical protein